MGCLQCPLQIALAASIVQKVFLFLFQPIFLCEFPFWFILPPYLVISAGTSKGKEVTPNSSKQKDSNEGFDKESAAFPLP